MSTNSNPSQAQIAFAYGKYLDAHGGDSTAAMADLNTFLAGYSAPAGEAPTYDSMVLDKPAMIGNTIFAAGSRWFEVVQRAMTEYEQRGDPQPSDVRIAEFRSWIEQGMPAQQYATP